MRKGGWTQASLGRALGVAQVTVGAWVNGKNLPDARNLRRLAELAGEDPIWLFRQVGYLPPESAAEGRYSPVLTPRSLELVNLFNHLTEDEQDLELEVLRLRERHGKRKYGGAEQPHSTEHASAPDNGSPAAGAQGAEEQEPSLDRLTG